MSGKAIPVLVVFAFAGLLSACVYSYRDSGYVAQPSGYGIDENSNSAPYHDTGERREPVPD